MSDRMRQVANRLYTFQVKVEDPVFVELMDHSLAKARQWDEPELDEIVVGGHSLEDFANYECRRR